MEGGIHFVTLFPPLESAFPDPFPVPRIQFFWEKSLDYIFRRKALGVINWNVDGHLISAPGRAELGVGAVPRPGAGNSIIFPRL